MTLKGKTRFKKEGAELKAAREKQKIFAKEVAGYFNKSVRTVYRWEDTGEGLTPFIIDAYRKFLKTRKCK